MFKNLLRTDGSTTTLPAVAYGGPVHRGLYGDCPKQFSAVPEVLSVHTLKLSDSEDITPVLMANHPSKFFYSTGNTPKTKMTIMLQDLIAAGWQIQMANNWSADPQATLAAMKERWAKDDDVMAIVDSQILEFGDIGKYWKPNVVLGQETKNYRTAL